MGELILFALIFAVGLYIAYRQAKKKFEAYEQLLQREGLERSERPCGLDSQQLRRLAICPEGGRDCDLRFGVSGRQTLTFGDQSLETDVAAFVWWWEEWRNNPGDEGGTGDYVEKSEILGAVRLPTASPNVTIGSEGRLARWGIGGRDDLQVESEEFNRRFEVTADDGDKDLVVRLLSPDFQQTLVEQFEGRDIQLAGDVLLIAGDPPGEDPDLYSTIGELPGARRDAVLVADHIPASFWRGLDHDVAAPAVD